MAIDSYMYFMDYNGNYMASESQVAMSKTTDNQDLYAPFGAAATASLPNGNHGLFEVEDYSFDVEQTLNIGSQSSGAGAGKISFNPFSITRKIDISSAPIFQMACAGTPFKQVGLGLRKTTGGSTTGGATVSGAFFLAFTFKLVAVKTISWAHDDESPKETITFEYGALDVQYAQQKQNGQFLPTIFSGWNKVQNISDTPGSTIGGSGS